ncbi:MAG: hypothetical protein A2445_03785 [Candidatus Jacksonbacteria bacterium RIFOXYC2_FULL_44_29]|nr:MAG: hypothetical protein A2240_02495 [Candidatus Jacksonbacteria bacterium RIFOXYA2_FULL_43_12]OGY77269.1 MAG: hypothetical protein A2445_03785 [Candidatus Jacksonbacteria bacterium RIFOXYC2_FULL_44_29]OGY77815.1 MAG: hypothetical protein A2295_04420 [Candidatus Jacksonbacteria bacterium RIFOXYB2_FULL_44_15]OGY78299.1 MAG: hypothetical protein A2550_03780 [Candidatus Jacksonbacteria bacterium RIFOXYD2_FULL_43_21]
MYFGRGKKTRQNFKIAREANLRLSARKVIWGELKNGSNWAQTPWAAIQAAQEKIGKISESLILVSLYNEIRTFFEKNY